MMSEIADLIITSIQDSLDLYLVALSEEVLVGVTLGDVSAKIGLQLRYNLQDQMDEDLDVNYKSN
jgi:hypothetical protein